MLLVHQWLDQYGSSALADTLRHCVAESVQFDCGDYAEIPRAKVDEFAESKAPFPATLLQFETPSASLKSHVIILWKEHKESVVILGAEKARIDNKWRTVFPTIVTRDGNGNFTFEGVGHEENRQGVMAFCAMAMNLFYILGCSNVGTVTHPAPKALNKKREKSGKFPIMEYKTLEIKVDKSRVDSQSLGGTHSSPRVHLRRGHVRHIQSGKRVWVQSCVVGSKHGMILKDYRVTH